MHPPNTWHLSSVHTVLATYIDGTSLILRRLVQTFEIAYYDSRVHDDDDDDDNDGDDEDDDDLLHDIYFILSSCTD